MSVVLAVRDGARHLPRAIDSVCRQTLADLEILVIDDASTDRTPEILAAIEGPRVRVLRNEAPLGLAASLNRGLAEARGPLVARIDHDDEWLPRKLTAQIAHLVAHPDVDVLGTWVWVIDEDGRPQGVWQPPTGHPEILAHFARGENVLVHPSVIFRRDVVLDLGGYDLVDRGQDFALWCKLALAGRRLANLPEHLVRYRVHGTQMSARREEGKAAARGIAERLLARVLPPAVRGSARDLAEFLSDTGSGGPPELAALARAVPEHLARATGLSQSETMRLRAAMFPRPEQRFHAAPVDTVPLSKPDVPPAPRTRDPVRGLASVLVPCLNGAATLAAAIGSALDQTYPAVEVIVVDNGSTDGSAEIARRFGDRVHVLHESRRGLSHARNRGLAAARGEFIQLLDADDLLHPEKIARHVAFLDAHPDIDIVYSDVALFDDRTHSAFLPADFVREARDPLTAFCARNLLAPVSALFRRSLLMRVGDFDPALCSAEDWDYWFRAALAGCRFHFDPAVLAYYRRHAGQMTSSGATMIPGIERLLTKLDRSLVAECRTPARVQALVFAHLAFLERWRRADFGREGAGAIVRSLIDLVREAGGPETLARMPGSGLDAVEEALLPARLAFALREEDPQEADALFAAGASQMESFLARSDLALSDARAIDHQLRVFFADAARVGLQAWTARLTAVMRTAVRCIPAHALAEMCPGLAGVARLAAVLQNGGAHWRRVVLYGAGLHTLRLLDVADWGQTEVIGILDDDPAARARPLHGLPVIGMEEAIAARPDAVIISSDSCESEIDTRCGPLRRAGIPVARLYNGD